MQVGRLELENMELEQHRIVHESILKGKDLVIQKLRLQLAVRDKLIQRQQNVLTEHGLDGKVGHPLVSTPSCPPLLSTPSPIDLPTLQISIPSFSPRYVPTAGLLISPPHSLPPPIYPLVI